MGGGGGTSSTTSQPIIPPQIRSLMDTGVGRFQAFGENLWDQMMPGVSQTPRQGWDPDNRGGGSQLGGNTTELQRATRQLGRIDRNPRTAMRPDPNPRPGALNSGWVPQGWWQPSSQGILGDNARRIIGPSQLEDWAAGRVTGLADMTPEFGAAGATLADLRAASQRRVTGESIRDDPALAAAMRQFDKQMRPMIETQAALQGLNKSTALNAATSAQQAQTVLPMIQAALGREERALEAERGGLRNIFEGQLGMSDRRSQQERSAIEQAMGIGGVGRQMSQDQADALYNDYMRRAQMLEQNINMPLQAIGGMVGSTSTSRSSGK